MAKIEKSEEEWKQQLTDEQYQIARQKATEPAFSGKYWHCYDDGSYHCVCCDQILFASTTKFDSGCGWPSFDQAVDGSVYKQDDYSIPNRPRIEVLCSQCDAHLGHVFDDGPTQTGQRYCINSAVIHLNRKDSEHEG